MSTKAKPTKLSAPDLTERERFSARHAELQRVIEQAHEALVANKGAWDYWREQIIWPRYGLGENDSLNPDGTIERSTDAPS